MFIRPTKHVITQATKAVFDSEYPLAELRNIYVDIEYPYDQANYPGIWVDFEVTGQVTNVGIGHREYAETTLSTPEAPQWAEYMRWRFNGYGVWTLVALSSYERDRLFDEMLRVIAFGGELAATRQFRAGIEVNDYIALEAIWDEINVSSPNAIPGTPWGTEEIIYETTVRISMVGEFVSGGNEGLLIPLSAVQLYPYTAEEGDPLPGETPPWQP